ncbi:MAG: metallophosphoesterase family protein [Gemmatimonadales bacterium]
MSRSIVHLSDPHFGELADLGQIGGVEELIPDLEPRAIVISGDLTQRARHGEFQAAKAFARSLERTAPVFVIPGNHEVQWWRRPLVPFGRNGKYRKYMRYFGPILAPTLALPEACVAGVLTSHGVSWGSLTARPRDLAVKGHLPKKEIVRTTRVFAQTNPRQLRVLVVHHNILRGQTSGRMGLARWKLAQSRIMKCGADVVLCGHDHQERADLLGDIVVSCAGTLSSRRRGDRPAIFNRVCWDDDSIQVELYRWDLGRHVFRRSDVYAFARVRRQPGSEIATRAG